MRNGYDNDRFPLSGMGQREGRRAVLLCAVGALSMLLTVVSFLSWREGVGDGEIARAASRVEEFFSEHEAVAVFFGWDAE